MKLPYKEGTWFAIPLREGDYGVGRVARHAPKGRIILAYLFGPRRATVSSLEEVSSLSPQNAIKIWQIGDLGLIDGSWPIIGDSAEWQRERWPMPQFIRKPDFGRAAWRVTYPDDNPNGNVKEERIPYETTGLERDVLHGSKAVEISLSQILSKA